MQVPDITLPPGLANIVARLPVGPPSWLFVRLLNELVRRRVVPADMALLGGRRFEIHVADAGIRLRFAASDKSFIMDRVRGEPDLRLSASLADFGRMMLREEDPDTLFFKRRLVIEGDTELGLIVKNLLDSVDWSRTPLARYVTR